MSTDLCFAVGYNKLGVSHGGDSIRVLQILVLYGANVLTVYVEYLQRYKNKQLIVYFVFLTTISLI